MSLGKRLTEYKLSQEAGEIPPITSAHLEVIYRSAHNLHDTGQHHTVLTVGDPFPAFDLPDESGTIVSSAKLLARGPLVVVFYRGVWCDYCNFELEALEQVYPRLKELGAELVAVSPVTMPNLRAAIRRNKITFSILSDRGNRYASQFNLAYKMSDELLAVWGGFGLDFKQVNGDDSATMPMPGVFVASSDSVIWFAEVHPLHWQRTEPATVVEAVEKIVSAS